MVDSYGIAAIAPFSHRLAFDNMHKDIQRLRCKVNFQALRFVPHIRSLGDALVNRLRYPPGQSEVVGSKFLREVTDANGKQGAGKFAVIHLRFDKVWANYVMNVSKIFFEVPPVKCVWTTNEYINSSISLMLCKKRSLFDVSWSFSLSRQHAFAFSSIPIP